MQYQINQQCIFHISVERIHLMLPYARFLIRTWICFLWPKNGVELSQTEHSPIRIF